MGNIIQMGTHLGNTEPKGAAGEGVDGIATGADAGFVVDDLDGLAVGALAAEASRYPSYVGRDLQRPLPPEGRLVVPRLAVERGLRVSSRNRQTRYLRAVRTSSSTFHRNKL